MATKYEELLNAETEPDDPEPEPEPEPGPTSEPEPGEPDEPPEEPLAFNPDTFEKEQRRHERELRKVLGDAFVGMEACATCGGIGFTPAGAEPVEPLPEPKPDPTLVVCGECNAYGFRTTPSLAENYATITCTVCNGTGYRDRDALAAIEAAAAYAAPPPYEAPPPPPTWNPQTRQWQDASGQPVYVVPTTPPYPAPVT